MKTIFVLILSCIFWGAIAASDDSSVMVDDPGPAADDHKPLADDPRPAADDPKPAAEDPKPAAKDPKPAADDTTPTADDTIPAPAVESISDAVDLPSPEGSLSETVLVRSSAQRPKSKAVVQSEKLRELDEHIPVRDNRYIDFNKPRPKGGPQIVREEYDPNHSRIAPDSSSQFGNSGVPFVLTDTQLKADRSEFLYWFFDQGGNNGNGDFQHDIHQSTPQIHKNFNFQLPFFGFRFNYTRVSTNGYLEFSDPPEHLTYPLSFPIKEWPKKNDPSFIGIFYSKCRIGNIRTTDVDQRAPGVYFRLERDLMGRTDQFGVRVRERLMWDIREGVVGANNFVPKHAVIVTWKNVSFSGGIDNSLYKTNTFQLVLATDEVFTYAIFNYADIQWTSHTEAGGDTTGGEGGVPAYIGFNAGNGTRSYEYLPYSQAMTLRDLTSRGWANGFPGRHIFRIDENILIGTCNKDIAGANLPLTFAPESGNMLGGTIVNITGPCFTHDMKITCKFDTETVVGKVVDTNRAICVQPFLLAEGYVLFDIAVGDGKFNWKGKYFVETPATSNAGITFSSDAVHEKDATEILIQWDKRNLTAISGSTIQISLWGYKETTIAPQFTYIDLLEAGVQNTGSYKISPANYRQRKNYYLDDMTFGFLQINLTNPMKYGGFTVSPVLWSKPIPLGWYFRYQWEDLYGKKWPEALCDKWIMNDRYLKNFAAEIAQCPCTLQQALNDKGRFLPDFDCDIDSNPNCRYHKGAKHCVRTGAPSLEGSEQQCCYDKNDYLMLSYDQQWGSRPKRSSNIGLLPWNEANKVPTLSQWYHDMSSFYLCCLWQEEQAVGCETYRFERRPSQDCVAYQSPYVATVFGDPHVVTFDDLEYTFNGKGEFVLVHTSNDVHKLDIQARFEQLPINIYGEVAATQLTAIAAKDNTSHTIEVRMRPKEAQWRYRLDVMANGKRVYFDRSSYRIQHFPGVTVYQPSYILNQSQIVIMFQSGVGVEVIENNGYMAARIYLPWTHINETRGLLGNWSFDVSNDFTLPNGQIVPVGNINDFERVHKDFAMKWLLEDRTDPNKGPPLFTREYTHTASYYSNKTFMPVFKRTPQEIIPPNRTADIEKAESFCGNSYQCRYDYAVSLNKDMALYTLLYYSSFTKIKERNKKPVITCGVLETPRFGRKSTFLFVPGTKVIFECNQDFVLIGDQRRTCTAYGRWDHPEYGYTECLRATEYSLRTSGITAAIIAGVMLPLLIILACIAAVYFRKCQAHSPSQSWTYNRESSLRLIKRPPVGPIEPSAQPDSSLQNRTGKKPKRIYDGVYLTNEPVPGMPENVEFKNKLWGLEDGDDANSRSLSSDPSSLRDTYNSFPETTIKRHGSIETDIM